MMNVIHMALKDLLLLWKDKLSLFFVLVFPLLMALITGTIFGGTGSSTSMELVMAVIDKDATEGSKDFIARLNESPSVEVAEFTSGEDGEPLSISEKEELARNLVRKGRLDCFLILDEGFGTKLSKFWLGSPELSLGIDPSRSAKAGLLEGVVMKTWFSIIQKAFTDKKYSQELIDQSLKDLEDVSEITWVDKKLLEGFLSSLKTMLGNMEFSEGGGDGALEGAGGLTGVKIKKLDVAGDRIGPKSAFEVTFPSGILWAIIGCVASFAVSIVRERTGGSMLRLKVSPVSFGQIMAGKALAASITIVAVVLVLTLISQIGVFNVTIASYGKYAMAIAASTVCFVGLTMFISVIGKTEQAVSGASWGILLLLGMFGGAMIPLFVMSRVLITISKFSPISWGILAFEGAIWRDFSYTEMVLPCAILVGVGAICFTAGVSILKRQES